MLNLDTHILLFALQDALTKHERAILSRDRWGISSIVLWEITKLHQKGRVNLSVDHPLMVKQLEQVMIWPLSSEVCLNLRLLDFATDPADELIAATSLTYQVPLVTRDAKLRSSKRITIV